MSLSSPSPSSPSPQCQPDNGHVMFSPAGDWSSCFEWCLSKPNHCTQIWVEVRRNGSGLRWEGCSNIQDTVCPVADKELVEHTTCDNPEEDCKVWERILL